MATEVGALQSVQEKVKERIQATFMDLLPAELFDGMVKQHLDQFIKADLPLLVKAKAKEEFEAYLKANDAYWKAVDELPLSVRDPGVWRAGTPRDATRVSLEAALAIAPAEQAKPSAGGEALAEQFIQAAIANSPQPLKDLGKHLAAWLDEDRWSTAEKLLLQLAAATPTPSQGAAPDEVKP